MSSYARSPAPNPIPLESLGRYPLYRIKIPSDFLDLLVGATLGNRYNVLSVIGRGGMSVVYKAKEINTSQVVAVKTLRTQSLTDEMVVKRFQREAELLSRLNHPRIVNLHAYGTSARGQPYFVMDFLQGDNLVTVLKRDDHLDPERFQDIFVQVCAAIEHAHKHGAIHRDIKPGNIMLTRTKRTKDYVKVVDFGIAKLAEEAQKLTRMGEVWGSPIYMSPEQCMGAAIDARSDIYSLGIVMYECLTGRVPFLGRNYADTMGKQISEMPPPFKKIRPDLDIPESLEAIVMMALAKEPEHRYQSLTQMRKDLESALSAQPNPAVSVPPKSSTKDGKGLSKSAAQVASSRDSSNKMKAPDGKKEARPTQSKSNMRSQTTPDMERPRKNTITRSRLEPAVINPHRLRNLVLIAGGSLLVTASVIMIFTHGDQVASVVASVLKQMVGGSDDDQKQEKDPQQALQEWLAPGGAASTASGTGQSTGQSTDQSIDQSSDQNPDQPSDQNTAQNQEDLKQQQEDEAQKIEQQQSKDEHREQPSVNGSDSGAGSGSGN